jgi:hypothetical protein
MYQNGSLIDRVDIPTPPKTSGYLMDIPCGDKTGFCHHCNCPMMVSHFISSKAALRLKAVKGLKLIEKVFIH